MAISQAGTAALVISAPGLLAFILAVVAENKKPTTVDSVILPNGAYHCLYPKDPTVALGALAIVLLFVSAILAAFAVLYPYNGKRVPTKALTRSTSLVVFAVLSLAIFVAAEALIIWAVVVESDHRKNDVYFEAISDCPTAKAGLLGGAGFLALDATLFFLITLMLTVNARADYLDEDEDDNKGAYGEVTAYHAPSATTTTDGV